MDSLHDEGRTAPAGRLSQTLASSRLPYLEGALDNPAFTPAHLLLLLRSPAVTPALIARIVQTRTWLRSANVKAEIATHPKTPRVVAAVLLSTLHWRVLAQIAERRTLDPQIRHQAEGRLITMIDEMAVGERIALARIAGREIVPELCHDDHPRVITALLQNPRLLEKDTLRIAGRKTAPSGVLKALSESDRSRQFREVQKAIARHPNTPSPIALRMLQELRPPDLKEILRGSRAPRLIKVATARLLGQDDSGGRRPRRRRGSAS